jgi:hypothetical protein
MGVRSIEHPSRGGGQERMNSPLELREVRLRGLPGRLSPVGASLAPGGGRRVASFRGGR